MGWRVSQNTVAVLMGEQGLRPGETSPAWHDPAG